MMTLTLTCLLKSGELGLRMCASMPSLCNGED